MAKIKKRTPRGNVIYYGNRRPRGLSARRKLTMREKLRPVGSKYAVEVRLARTYDIEYITMYGGAPLNPRQQSEYDEVHACIETLRTMGSGFKIVRTMSQNMIQVKVLLEREGDLMLMLMAHPDVIFRIYKLVEQRNIVV